jgi:glutathione synthase/RimK-type ligase-like ATP-grasp enzyme
MILICAKDDDPHAVAVSERLRKRHGQHVFVFDTSRLPALVSLTATFGGGNGSGPWHGSYELTALDSGQRIRLDEISAIWWRRPQPMDIDPAITDPTARHFTMQECISALYGVLACCDTLWVNDLKNDVLADHKPYQLKVAGELGFNIPHTVITSEPDRVVSFWRDHRGSVIYKAFNQRGLVWRPTRRLTEEDLATIANVRYAPVIFQALVPGIRDVRITAIGGELIATEFDIERPGTLDYRLSILELSCRPHVLPPDVQNRLRRLMDALGLEYGGIDLRLTADGTYVFFEVNTAGEFMYLQDRTGQPIADLMAARLAEGVRATPSSADSLSMVGATPDAEPALPVRGIV